MTIAITGATGAVGGLVARALADNLRTELRLVVRDPSRAPDYDTDVRACTYGDESRSIAALRGVDTLFMVSAAESADRREQHRTFIRAAAAAGVGHIVYTSFAGAAPDATFALARDHHDAEEAVRADGLTRMLGVAPGPANGFTLDVIDCLERFGDRIDWAMVILNPLEPWPGELVIPAAERHDVKLITRVVDYGGLFHDDVLPGHEFPRYDHRGFRPAGWVEAGRAKLERMRPVATEMVREFPVPVLHVDTTDGYTPNIETVLEFVTAS